MRRLEGQRALVTGASSGIGAATAQLLAREGADVALVARSERGLHETATRVTAEGRRAITFVADTTDRAALERAVQDAAQRLGGIDIAVVSAAAAAFGTFAEMPAEDFDRCVEVTFGGSVNTIRAVLPHLERTRGRLVVVGSAADRVPIMLLSPYVAAKHALAGFLRTLRIELKASRSGVRLSVIRPGAVDTPFLRHLTHPAHLTPPLTPPLVSYTTASVARATVACAIRPRASVTIGAATLLLEVALVVARPLVERAFSLLMRTGRRRASPDPEVNALWEPSGDGRLSAGQNGRPSLYAALRLGRTRPERAAAR